MIPLDAAGTGRRFLDAVIWGEHHAVWELMAGRARVEVLRVATRRGLDEALAARIRDGVASPTEQDRVLADLVNGLRADLAGGDLDALQVEAEAPTEKAGEARLLVVVPAPSGLDLPGLPVASLELVQEDRGWRVARLVPVAPR